jgi:hypothetical protein
VRSKRVRYAAPAAVVVALGIGAFVPTISGASSPPDLPAQSPAQLLANVAAAKPPQLSGTVTWNANVGLSDLSDLTQSSGQGQGGASAGNGFNPLTLLSGNYQMKVWLDGNAAEHIALIEPSAQEVDLVRNGNQAWYWDSSTQSVLHLIGPKTALPGGASSPAIGTAGLPLTPGELAGLLLGRIGSGTSVATGAPLYVAGQPAYSLIVKPKTSATTVNHIEIDIGASGSLSGVPLQVAVYANNQVSPALELGFGQISLGAPPASELTFTAPPGSTVKTETIGSGASQSGVSQSAAGLASGGLFGFVRASSAQSPQQSGTSSMSGTTRTGAGWASVISGPEGQVFNVAEQGTLSEVTTVKSFHGQWGRLFSTSLLNVLLMPNGRFYAGLVTPKVLESAASSST